MKIKSDAKNSDGMLLIPSGCILSEKHIDILMTWDVPTLEVEEDAASEAPGDPLQSISSDELLRWKTAPEFQLGVDA